MSSLEIAANAFTAVCIVLAGRNNVHTWWTGIVGCALFAFVFHGAKLYADTLLQLFFIATGFAGWYRWRRQSDGETLPVRWTPRRTLALLATTALGVALLQAWLLMRYTDGAAPLADSAVFAGSVLAQFLLMGRRVENWAAWIVVNTIAVPLFASRELYLTAVLYAFYWVNAIIALRYWKRLAGPR